MFLADDIVLFPFKSILFIFREIHNAVVQEQADEAQAIRAELSDLYLQLESGALDEAAFDARESELLDRLELIEPMGIGDEDESDEEDESEEDESEEDDETD